MSTADFQSDSLPPASVTPARFTAAQFDQLIEVGFFDDLRGKKVQLYRGEIQYVTPPNPPHDDVVTLLSQWAFRAADNKQRNIAARCQCSMDFIHQSSVLLPDIVLVADQSYSTRRPSAEDTCLLIEVADSTLRHDLNDKRDLFAEAGIREYWVIDIPHRSLISHRDLADSRYRNIQTHDENQTVQPTLVPDLDLQVGALFR